MKKKTIIVLAVIVVVLLAIGVGCSWYFLYEKPHSEAVAAFNEVVSEVDEKNAELDDAINVTATLVESGKKPLDDAMLAEAETAITVARGSIRTVPEMPSDTGAIQAAVTELSEPLDHSKRIAEIEEKKAALENSIKQYEQVTNPSEAFVVERLQGIETITGVSAVTEDNDPNGQLNKQGGYTACVYFSDSQVNQDNVFGDTIIDKGTQGGGAIEVFATAEAAEARNTYLAAYDGSILSSGSHRVVGTVLIRTSDELTATQQTDLESRIVANLTELR